LLNLARPFRELLTAKIGGFKIKSAVLNPIGWVEGRSLDLILFKETLLSILCLAGKVK
jgi:hypothetical protein